MSKNSSISNNLELIHKAQLGATIPVQSGPGSDGIEAVLCIPQAPALLEPHHQIV